MGAGVTKGGAKKYFNIRQSPWLEARKLGPSGSLRPPPRISLVSSLRGFQWNLASFIWAAFDARYSHSNCRNPSQSACENRRCTKWKSHEAVRIRGSTCNSHNGFYGKNIRSYFFYTIVLTIPYWYLMSEILLSPKILDITETKLQTGKENNTKSQNCVNAHVAAWKEAKYEANLFILNNGSKWTILYRVKQANNWEATGTEKHQSLARSFSSFPCQLITLLRG